MYPLYGALGWPNEQILAKVSDSPATRCVRELHERLEASGEIT